jgi:chromosomal replication initiation ATPase DnaA
VISTNTLEALTCRDLLEPLDLVCISRGVTREEVCGRGRTKNVSFARKELWFHLRQHPGMSYDEIGRLFGRNRTTVMGGVRSYLRAIAAMARSAA